ncbi:hypothetical protein ACFLZJ_01150 [Nanoarchaeota archaeon]
MAKTFFITGAEGTGKTSIIPYLKENLPNLEIHDFDEVGVPENPPLQWRLDTTLYWIKIAEKNQEKNLSTCIIGLSFPSEVNDFKESEKLNKISFCLLDVNKEEREKRLGKRNASNEVIADIDPLNKLRNEIKKLKVIDTSNLSIEETANKVINWIKNET